MLGREIRVCSLHFESSAYEKQYFKGTDGKPVMKLKTGPDILPTRNLPKARMLLYTSCAVNLYPITNKAFILFPGVLQEDRSHCRDRRRVLRQRHRLQGREETTEEPQEKVPEQQGSS